MTCKNCNNSIDPSASFCPQCGTPVEQEKSANQCKNCNTENLESAKFCMTCGEQLGQQNYGNSRVLLQQRYLSLISVGAISVLVVLGYYYLGFVSSLEGKETFASDHNHEQPTEQKSQAEPPVSEPPSVEEIEEVKSRLANNPDNYGLNVQLGNLLFDSKQFLEAIPYYQKAIKTQPNSPDVIVDLGVSYFNLQRYNEAKGQFELALQANPDHVNALYNMGVIAMQDREPEKLIQYWTKLQQVAPQSHQAIKAGEILDEIHRNVQQFSGDGNSG